MYRFPIMQHRLHSVTRFFPFLKKIFNDRTDDALFFRVALELFLTTDSSFIATTHSFLRRTEKLSCFEFYFIYARIIPHPGRILVSEPESSI